MGKLSIPRLALAIAISGIFLLPPTDSVAAPAWLEKLFSGPQDKARKHRKPRPVKKARRPAAKIVTPLVAPVPGAKPGNRPPIGDEQQPDAAPMPAENPQAAAPGTKRADPSPSLPTPQPKPAVPEDRTSNDPSATMPESVDAVPVPEPSPRATPEDKQPTQQPAGPVQEPPMPPAVEASPQGDAPPETAPIPAPNPRATTEKPDETGPGKDMPRAEPVEPPPPDPRSALRPDPSGDLPAEEVACRQRLAGLGVEFDNRPAKTDPSGCSMPYPLTVRSLGKDIGLRPDAEMNCAMAEAAARFAQDVVAPTAKQIFGEQLASITHASAYVCRPRNGTLKLSEHAFGNALDISSFTLTGGTSISVQPHPDAKAAGFLGKVRAAACGPFKTVLGPGSDADHSEHLHFDLAPRRNGGTVCE